MKKINEKKFNVKALPYLNLTLPYLTFFLEKEIFETSINDHFGKWVFLKLQKTDEN